MASIGAIEVVDADTELLARLDGVEATIEEPVVATVVDNDLFFTADGDLWRLDNALV